MFEILNIRALPEKDMYEITWRATYSPKKTLVGTSVGGFDTFPTKEEALGILDRVLNKPAVIDSIRKNVQS